MPTVVAGFEPIDVLLPIYYILDMRENKPKLINEYIRVVKPEDNIFAKKVMSKAYEVRNAYGREIGVAQRSGGYNSKDYLKHDLYHYLEIDDKTVNDILPSCKCPEVTHGIAKPTDSPLFMKTYTPSNPYGPCMVSSKGTCRIWAENPPLKIK